MTTDTDTTKSSRRRTRPRIVYATAADRDAAARVVPPAAAPGARAKIVASGPGHVTAALVPVRRGSSRPADPVEQEIRLALRLAMRVVARLAGVIPGLGRLRGSCSGEILDRLANGPTGKNTGVPDETVDMVETVVGWVRSYVADPIDQRLVLAWATGASWAALVEADPLGRQQRQLSKILGNSIRAIAAGLLSQGREKEIAESAEILL